MVPLRGDRVAKIRPFTTQAGRARPTSRERLTHTRKCPSVGTEAAARDDFHAEQCADVPRGVPVAFGNSVVETMRVGFIE